MGILLLGPPHGHDLDVSVYRELYQVQVLPTAWGRGVGSALHDAFTGSTVSSGCTRGVLEAWEANARAQRFYAKHGWRADGVRRRGPEGIDFIRLQLVVG